MFRQYRQSVTRINALQNKHIEGTEAYDKAIAKGEFPSILRSDASTLLKEGAGTGIMHGNKEIVDFGRVIGEYGDLKTKTYHNTTMGAIHYNTKGSTHIVPIKPNDWIET